MTLSLSGNAAWLLPAFECEPVPPVHKATSGFQRVVFLQCVVGKKSFCYSCIRRDCEGAQLACYSENANVFLGIE